MQTQCLSCKDAQSLAYAVQLLRAGQVIAFPTDTVYGVGADGFNERAIEQLFVVKERERGKAIPYLLADTDDLAKVVREMPRAAQILAEKFWPGGLTLIVPASPRVPKILMAGGDTVAVRVPNHPTPRALIATLGVPLAATSANISGGPDPANAQEVLAQLNGRLPLVLDGGATRGNVPSSVVDVTSDPPKVLRVGVIAVEEIERVLGQVG
jgi:L-threonylcarbamoyladenylate synthase